MYYNYSYTAFKKQEDTIKYEDEDIYFPILSELGKLIYHIDYYLNNQKQYVLKNNFSYTFKNVKNKMITNIKIDAPNNAKMYMSLGGSNITDLTNIHNISIPCVEYHTIILTGTLVEQFDTINISYELQDIEESIESFKIGNDIIRIKEGMYGKINA